MNAQTNYSIIIDLTFASCQTMQIAEYITREDLDIGSPHKLIPINLDKLPEKKMDHYRNKKFNQIQIHHISKKLKVNLPEKLKCFEADAKPSASCINSLSFLQINLQHSYVALLELYKKYRDGKTRCYISSRPICKYNFKVSSAPPNLRCFSKFDPSKRLYSATVFVINTLKADLHFGVSTNEYVVVYIYARKKTFTVV